MSMRFTCGATLPTAQRYSDPRFRRVSRRFYPRKVGEFECIELAAFLHVVPIRWARWIFQWDRYGLRAADYVLRNFQEAAEPFADENVRAMDVADGLAVVRGMQDGGWRHGKLPDLSRNALFELRDAGLSAKEIAALAGLTVNQVEYQFRTKDIRGKSRAFAIGGLGIG